MISLNRPHELLQYFSSFRTKVWKFSPLLSTFISKCWQKWAKFSNFRSKAGKILQYQNFTILSFALWLLDQQSVHLFFPVLAWFSVVLHELKVHAHAMTWYGLLPRHQIWRLTYTKITYFLVEKKGSSNE